MPLKASEVAGTKYHAYVQYGINAQVREVTLLPLAPRRVLVRTQASVCCYTVCRQALGSTQEEYDHELTGNHDPVGTGRVLGHGGVGIVEAVAPEVKRVQVGDQVIVPITSDCGQCYNCLRGRGDHCRSELAYTEVGKIGTAIGTLSDGSRVIQHLDKGGFAEFMVAPEESCVPIVTKVPPVELALLNCAGAIGLMSTMTKAKVEPGSDVVVIGGGPLGLSAVQGARIMGAAQIILVEPVQERRDLALRIGATAVLDPNAEGANLLNKIRQLCKGRTDRIFAGGGNGGPDFVVEAVGGDLYPPQVPGPDTTGLSAIHQAWEIASPVADIVTMGFNVDGNFTIPAAEFSNAAKHHFPGNLGGLNGFRDIPRAVRLIETGQFNAKAMVTAVHPLEETRQAYQKVADRTTVTAVISFV
jgi:S-(hydroxymethyl)glutathione dehydrogenase/alcohol dehydrogenase